MAQAVEQHTTREWSLTDYHRYVRITLGCGINVALCEMERRIVSGRLLLLRREFDANDNLKSDAVEIDRFAFLSNYTFQLDTSDQVQVVRQRPTAGLWPGGITTIKFDPSDHKNSVVRTGPSRLMDDYYTVIERPSPDQQSKDKAKGWQVRHVKQALKKLFPPNGHPHLDLSQKTILDRVNKFLKQRDLKPASRDTLARAMGRRRA